MQHSPAATVRYVATRAPLLLCSAPSGAWLRRGRHATSRLQARAPRLAVLDSRYILMVCRGVRTPQPACGSNTTLWQWCTRMPMIVQPLSNRHRAGPGRGGNEAQKKKKNPPPGVWRSFVAEFEHLRQPKIVDRGASARQCRTQAWTARLLQARLPPGLIFLTPSQLDPSLAAHNALSLRLVRTNAARPAIMSRS